MKINLHNSALLAVSIILLFESFMLKDKNPKPATMRITAIAYGILNKVSDLKKGPDGELYILNDNKIIRIVEDRITDTISIPNELFAGQEHNRPDESFAPVSFEIDSAGIIYISDGIHSIKKINKDGSFISLYATQFQGSKEPLYGADAMAINPIDGALYFTNNANPVVYKLSDDGEISRAVDLSYDDGAMSIAIAPDGVIWTGTWNRISRSPKSGNVAHYGFRSLAPYYGEGPLTDIRIDDFVSGMAVSKDGSTIYLVNEGQIKKICKGRVSIIAETANASKIALSKNEDALYFSEDGELKKLLLN